MIDETPVRSRRIRAVADSYDGAACTAEIGDFETLTVERPAPFGPPTCYTLSHLLALLGRYKGTPEARSGEF